MKSLKSQSVSNSLNRSYYINTIILLDIRYINAPLLIKNNQEEIVKYDDFNRIGKDSVKLEKISNDKFKFSLSSIGSWEEFKNNLNSIDKET